MPKLRYGLQLTHKVRLSEEDRKTKDITAAQIAQNKMFRLLDSSRIKDKRSIHAMLEKFDLLWINQTAGKIRLQEAWKAERDKNYPINQMRSKNTKDRGEQQRSVRMKTKKKGEKSLLG